MHKFRRSIVGLPLLAVMGLDCFSVRGNAQQKSIPKQPVNFIDASTRKPIPELLLIPRYSSATGVSTLLGEGPQRLTYRDYLAKPFVYRTGTPFILKLPKSRGLLLGPLVFIGKGRTLQGVLVLATGYSPRWFVELWQEGSERGFELAPMSGDAGISEFEELGPLEKGARRIKDDCWFWDLAAPCTLEIHFNEKERELVRSFLQRGRRSE